MALSPFHEAGFIGTGMMGAPMVRRLIKSGFRVSVWNRSPTKSRALVDSGAATGASPAELAAAADVVCLCVTDAAAVETVVFGEDGVASGARNGTVLVDFSSIRPDATRAMAARLHEATGMHWIDAPVSGGVKGATDGTLVIMCGGDEDLVRALSPLFDAVSKKVTHMGEVGAGQTTKLCNQVIVATNLLAISEALALGKAAGIHIDRLPEALAGGWADSRPLATVGPLIAAGGGDVRIGALATMLKDVDTALAVAEDADISLPVSAEVARIYREASGLGGPGCDLALLGAFYGVVDR